MPDITEECQEAIDRREARLASILADPLGVHFGDVYVMGFTANDILQRVSEKASSTDEQVSAFRFVIRVCKHFDCIYFAEPSFSILSRKCADEVITQLGNHQDSVGFFKSFHQALTDDLESCQQEYRDAHK